MTGREYGVPPDGTAVTKYRTIVADPPWDVRLATGRRRAGGKTGSQRYYEGRPAPYPQMSVEEIAALPVGEWAATDAGLFMWGVDKYAVDGSMAAIARAWGFEPGRLIVWEKNNPSQGRFPLVSHELILVCRRGGALVERWFPVHQRPALEADLRWWREGPQRQARRHVRHGRASIARPVSRNVRAPHSADGMGHVGKRGPARHGDTG